MLNFEECNDYESETFCTSEEEIATYWATKCPAMTILIIIKQVYMTDFDNPVQTYIKTAYLNPFSGKELDTTVYFEPNTFLSFEDQIGFIPFLPSPDPVTFFSAERPVTITNERTGGFIAPRATLRFELSDQKYTHTRRYYTIR